MEALLLWQEKGGDFKKILRSVSDALAPLDRNLAWELAVGTVKKLGRLERFLPLLLREKNPHPALKAILLLALFQLEEKKWPEYAVVNEAVLLAREFGIPKMAGVINACLRRFLRKPPVLQFSGPADELAGTYSYPEWMVEEWLALFGRDKTIRALAWGNGAPPTWVRLNRLKTTEAEFFELLSRQKFQWERSEHFEAFYRIRSEIPLDEFTLLKEGKGYIQDPSAALAVKLLDPHPGEKILDACAAPGGKTALITESGAEIIAVEKSPQRMKTLAANLKKLGAEKVKLVTADFLTHTFEKKFDPSTSLRFSRDKSPGVSGSSASPKAFDKVLLDVPCTGLGTVARHPELRWEKKKEDAVRLGAQALHFLERAAGLVSPGGIIVYSTCTLTAEENWDVVEKFLSSHPEFEREKGDRWAGAPFCDTQGNAAVLPGEFETDGVFGCRLVKK